MAEDIKGFIVSQYCANLLSDFDSGNFIEKLDKEENISSLKLADIFNYIVRRSDIATINNDTQLKPAIVHLIRHKNFNIQDSLLKDFSNQSWIEYCFEHQRYWIIAEVIYLIHEKDNLSYFDLLFGGSIKNILDILYKHHKENKLIVKTKMANEIYYVLFHVFITEKSRYVNEISKLFENVLFEGFPYGDLFNSYEDKFYFNEELMSVKNVYGKNVFMESLKSRTLQITQHKSFNANLQNMGISNNPSFYTETLKDDSNNNIFHKIPLFTAAKIDKIIPLNKEIVSLFFEENKYGHMPIERIKTKQYDESDIIDVEHPLLMFMLQFMPLSSENYGKYCQVRDECEKNSIRYEEFFSLKMNEDNLGRVSFSHADMKSIESGYYKTSWMLYDLMGFMWFCEEKYREELPNGYYRYSDTINVDKALKKHFIFNDADIAKLKESSSTKEKGSVSLIWLDKIVKMKGERILASNANILREIDDLRAMFPNFSEYLDFVEDNVYLNEISRGFFHLPPSLLLSGPGIGKTFFLSELSSRIGTFHDMINMESVSAGFSLTGMTAMYSESDAGRIFKNMHVSPYANPIFILDEIDKLTKSNHPVEPTLLSLLEEHSARNFKDEFIGIRCDISRVIWAATANDLNAISQPIKDRFELFEIKTPTFDERKILAQNIYKKVLINTKTEGHFNSALSNEALDYLCQGSESSRTMRKDLTKALARAAREKRKEIIVSDIKATENKRPFGF